MLDYLLVLLAGLVMGGILLWWATRVRRRGVVIWFTGVPASGKSTIAAEVERRLSWDYPVKNLDADGVRENLTPDLGYEPEDRDENTRRLAWMAKTLAEQGVIAIVTCVSPLRSQRQRAKQMAEEAGCRFIGVYVDCPLEVCQERDPKGLYARAEAGEIDYIAGLHLPYEKPKVWSQPSSWDLWLNSDMMTVRECADSVIELLDDVGIAAPV